jgi:hypothetical protein
MPANYRRFEKSKNGIVSSDFVQIYERGISLENIKNSWIYSKMVSQNGFG